MGHDMFGRDELRGLDAWITRETNDDADLTKCDRCGQDMTRLYDGDDVAVDQICNDCYNANDTEPDPVNTDAD